MLFWGSWRNFVILFFVMLCIDAVKLLLVESDFIWLLLFVYFGLQISDKNLIDLIRRKVKLNQPYAGVFLKCDDEYECSFYVDQNLLSFRHIK